MSVLAVPRHRYRIFFRACPLVLPRTFDPILIGDDPYVLSHYLAPEYEPRNDCDFYYASRFSPDRERIRRSHKISGRAIATTASLNIYAPDFTHPACFERGFFKRLCPISFTRETAANKLQRIAKRLVRQWTPLPRLELDEAEIRRWATSRRRYNNRKIERFVRLGMQALTGGVSRRKILRCKAFIKREFYDEHKEARIISSRSDYFKAIMGPYITRIEEQVYSNPHFVKGLAPVDLAKRLETITTSSEHLYETDYSSFEGSFNRKILAKVEWTFLHHFLRNNFYACGLAQATCFEPHHISSQYGQAVCAGSRMSGELWTSLCNGFMNMVLMEYIAEENGTKFEYVVEGDDGLICSKVRLDVSCVAATGFKLKLVEGRSLNDISFCGLTVCDGKLMPDMVERLRKTGWDHDIRVCRGCSQRLLDERVKAKAISLLATSRGVPILQEMALANLKQVSRARLRRKHLDWWEKEMGFFDAPILPEPVTDVAREFVAKRWGISITAQLQIERELKDAPDARCCHIDLTLLGLPRCGFTHRPQPVRV